VEATFCIQAIHSWELEEIYFVMDVLTEVSGAIFLGNRLIGRFLSFCF